MRFEYRLRIGELHIWSQKIPKISCISRRNQGTKVASAWLTLEVMAMWIWIAVSGALMLVELLTANLLFASLAISALAAALAAMLGADVLIQGIVFGVASLISLVLLRPIALRHLKTQGTKAVTNTDALIGKEAFTLSEVNERTGQIKLAGEVWSATSELGQIAADTKVVVIAIRGATAIIKEV